MASMMDFQELERRQNKFASLRDHAVEAQAEIERLTGERRDLIQKGGEENYLKAKAINERIMDLEQTNFGADQSSPLVNDVVRGNEFTGENPLDSDPYLQPQPDPTRDAIRLAETQRNNGHSQNDGSLTFDMPSLPGAVDYLENTSTEDMLRQGLDVGQDLWKHTEGTPLNPFPGGLTDILTPSALPQVDEAGNIVGDTVDITDDARAGRTNADDPFITPNPANIDTTDDARSGRTNSNDPFSPSEPPTVDSNNVPHQPNETIDSVINDIKQGDTGRSAGQRFDNDAEWNVGSITPVSEGKFGAGIRKKIGGFFGHDSEEELQRFGSGLSGFGAGLLTGGSDFGAAMGNGFQKSQEAFHGMRKDQRAASLADHKIAMDEEKRGWEREKMNEWRRQAALDRMSGNRKRRNDPIEELLKREEYRKKGVRQDDDGNYYIDPNHVDGGSLPDGVKDLETTIRFLRTPRGSGLLLPGETPEKGARRIEGIDLDDANPYGVNG